MRIQKTFTATVMPFKSRLRPFARLAVIGCIVGGWGMLACSGGAADEPKSSQVPAAEPAAPTTEPSDIEPQALEVLRAAGQYLRDAKSFSFSADVWEDVVFEGRKIQRQRTTEMGVRRPNGVYAESHNELVTRGLWYDGKTLTIYNRLANFYGTVPAPDTIDKTLDAIEEKFGMSLPLADLIDADMYAGITKNIRRGDYLGRQSVNGVRCHHLAFTQDTIDWEMWVQDGRAPVVCKIVITHKDEDLAPQFSATLSHWNFDARLPDYAFTFAPPLGATKIEVLPAKTFDK